MENRIFHLDMDCYFASVEMYLNPNLKNKPLAVGGRFHSGVVSSANYIARKQGVKSAMAIFMAKKICPELVVVNCNMNKYIEISEKIESFLLTVIKKIEKGSIDEWYIDVTDSKYESWTEFEFASYLKTEIKKRFHLDCTIGNSFTMFLAKMATDLCKPDGFLTLNKNNFSDYIYKLPIDEMVGVGNNLVKILKQEFNIHKIQDIVDSKNDSLIKKRLGVIWPKLKFNALGLNVDIVNTNVIRKNLGRSLTIKNYTEFIEFYNLIESISKEINFYLDKENFMFKSISLKLKLKDHNHLSKSYFYENYVDWFNFIDVINIFEMITTKDIYSDILNVSITANDLIKKDDFEQQLSLFDKSNNNKKTLNKSDYIKNFVNKKLNKKVVYFLSEKQK